MNGSPSTRGGRRRKSLECNTFASSNPMLTEPVREGPLSVSCAVCSTQVRKARAGVRAFRRIRSLAAVLSCVRA